MPATASKSFTAVGAGPEFLAAFGKQLTYDLSGTFAAVMVLQRFVGGGWTTVASATDIAASGTVTAEPVNSRLERYRWFCSAYTSGTAVTTISDVTSQDTAERRTPAGTLLETETEEGLELFSPDLSTPKGCVHAIERTFTETAGAGTYTASVAVPAGATILDIIVNGVALWNPATSAVMKVGDTDDDGFFTGIDLMATDLLAGESLSFALAGGKAGAYIANSQVSPRYSATARTINGIITTVGGSGTTGRTRMTVVYHQPVSGDIVAATKV